MTTPTTADSTTTAQAAQAVTEATPATVAAATAVQAVPTARSETTELGFPPDTPVAEMTPAERVAYDRHQREQNRARKAEWTAATGGRTAAEVKADLEELAALRLEKLTPPERAIEDARRDARAAALKETAPLLVRAEFKAAVAGRLTPEELNDLLEPMDLTKFLTPTGEVDTDKVTRYTTDHIPGGTKQWPDMGQGRRGTAAKTTGVAAGRELAKQRQANK